MFKSALDSGDKAQLQAVLDELNVKAMLEARQGGGVFGGRETKGQQDNGGKKKSSKKKKKSLRDGQKKVCSPFEFVDESFEPNPELNVLGQTHYSLLPILMAWLKLLLTESDIPERLESFGIK